MHSALRHVHVHDACQAERHEFCSASAVNGAMLPCRKAVTGLEWSRDGRRLVSGSLDGRVIRWNVEQGTQVRASLFPHRHSAQIGMLEIPRTFCQMLRFQDQYS